MILIIAISALIVFSVKAGMVVIKFGGVRHNLRLSFLFLRLLLGQFVVGSAWTLLGVITKDEFYGFFP